MNATLTVKEDKIFMDYNGTSQKSQYGINVPLSYTRAYTGFGLSCLISP